MFICSVCWSECPQCQSSSELQVQGLNKIMNLAVYPVLVSALCCQKDWLLLMNFFWLQACTFCQSTSLAGVILSTLGVGLALFAVLLYWNWSRNVTTTIASFFFFCQVNKKLSSCQISAMHCLCMLELRSSYLWHAFVKSVVSTFKNSRLFTLGNTQ